MASIHQMMLFAAGIPTSADLIVNHTSATSTSGTASASTTNSTRFPWGAFDGKIVQIADGWQATASTGWLLYQFTTAKVVTSYTLTPIPTGDVNVTNAPKTWTILASNTGAFTGEEVTLDTQTNAAAWAAAELRTFNIVNATPYIYYRLNVTASEGGANLDISEMRLIGY